jgi:photosynthetic reaction center H subunit
LRDAVGPAAYANRTDRPDLTFEGINKIVPLRVATDFSIASEDPDPRGMEVVGANGVVAGIVQDVWVDRSEIMLRFLEVTLTLPGVARTVLVPSNLIRVDAGRRRVDVKSILGEQFAYAPGIKNPDQITLLEEDRIYAYFAGGHLYAVPQRAEPIL